MNQCTFGFDRDGIPVTNSIRAGTGRKSAKRETLE